MRLLFVLALLIAGTPDRAAGESETVVVRIVHTNDLSGILESEMQDEVFLPGVARIAGAIAGLQEGTETVIVDAGDALGPAPLSQWDKGRTMAAFMQAAGYSALCVGNHEFDYGLESLADLREAEGMTFLASNIAARPGADLPFVPTVTVRRGPITIGILGAISREPAERINPDIVPQIQVLDPVTRAVTLADSMKAAGADYVVALVHMTQADAVTLAKAARSVDLVVIGGYTERFGTDDVTSLIRLTNGATLVTTPKGGTHVGYVDVPFTRQQDGTWRATAAQAELQRVDERQAPDLEVAQRVQHLLDDYVNGSGELLGEIDGTTLEEQVEAVANLMRMHTSSEAAIVSLGSYRKVDAPEGFHLRDVNRFIKFDERLVSMELTGKQLKSLLDQSRRRKEPRERLVFAGVQDDGPTVNGRTVENDETYRIITVEFLADGGDGYREFAQATSVRRTNISARSLTSAGLKAWGTLSPYDPRTREIRRVWRSGWSVEGSFRRNMVNATADSYRVVGERVSFLRGETSVAWAAATRYLLQYERGRNGVLLENRAEFGRVGGETSSDQFDADLTYRRRVPQFRADPFLSVGVRTAFTSGESGRPWLARTSAGFQRRYYRNWLVQFALRGQRDFAEKQSDYGAEVNLDYRHRLSRGGRFQSRIETFFGLSDRQVISVENYNTLSLPVAGALSLTVRQNNFIYKVNKVRDVPVTGVAFRTDLTVGLAYALDWKWL